MMKFIDEEQRILMCDDLSYIDPRMHGTSITFDFVKGLQRGVTYSILFQRSDRCNFQQRFQYQVVDIKFIGMAGERHVLCEIFEEDYHLFYLISISGDVVQFSALDKITHRMIPSVDYYGVAIDNSALDYGVFKIEFAGDNFIIESGFVIMSNDLIITRCHVIVLIRECCSIERFICIDTKDTCADIIGDILPLIYIDDNCVNLSKVENLIKSKYPSLCTDGNIELIEKLKKYFTKVSNDISVTNKPNKVLTKYITRSTTFDDMYIITHKNGKVIYIGYSRDYKKQGEDINVL